MKDAYLILCHNHLAQVRMLADYAVAHGHEVFIHVDAATEIPADFCSPSEHIHIIPNPVHVVWADWTVTQAMLLLMRAAASCGKEFRYVHLLSGQCLPAMAEPALDAELTRAAEQKTQFIQSYPMPAWNHWPVDGGMHRVSVWYPRWMVSKYSKWHRYFWPYTNKWRRLRLRRPGYFFFRPFYGGSQWWSLTGECVRAILAYADAHPFFTAFFKHTFCSDELFVQCCLMRTPFAAHVCNDNKRFLRWQKPNDPSPMLLDETSWPLVKESGCFFARKFAIPPEQVQEYLHLL